MKAKEIDGNIQAYSVLPSTYKKSNMSNGFDDIDYLINKKDQISAFANKLRY